MWIESIADMFIYTYAIYIYINRIPYTVRQSAKCIKNRTAPPLLHLLLGGNWKCQQRRHFPSPQQLLLPSLLPSTLQRHAHSKRSRLRRRRRQSLGLVSLAKHAIFMAHS